MKSTLTQKEHSQVLVTITVEEADLAPYKEKTAARISKQAQIPGFRPGTAPTFAVITHVGAAVFQEELVQEALPHLYYKAIMEHKLEPIAAPRMTMTSKEPLVFEALVAQMPPVKIKNIEKLKHHGEPVEVTDKEIDEVIHEMLKTQATFEANLGPVEKGNKVEINFKGFDEGGAELENTSSTNHPLFVGENSLIPGFEDNLIGMKVGDKKKFPITFPADYHHKPFQSKKVHFEVEIMKAEKALYPELDEAFIEKLIGKKETKEAFMKLVKEDIHARKKADDRRSREAKLMEAMLAAAEVDVPPVLIDEEVEYMIEDLRKRFEQQSGNAGGFDKFLESVKSKGKDPTERYKEEATQRVKLRLVMNQLFKDVKVEVSDEDMQKAGKALLTQAPEAERAAVEKQLAEKRGVYARLQNNLMLEKLLNHFLGE